jgi:hypothetical protein
VYNDVALLQRYLEAPCVYNTYKRVLLCPRGLSTVQ